MKSGKQHTRFREEMYKGGLVLEVASTAKHGQTNQEMINALKKRYRVYDSDIELIEGYASQCKRFRVTLRE
ncbi:DUF167 family protein [Brevibacillus sp. SYP-B805]|uniref:DUF167 family protein n=1 Tax=Brevibacillus sp. SYP-B805 TaxID=1578199 RepID=UPI0032180D75